MEGITNPAASMPSVPFPHYLWITLLTKSVEITEKPIKRAAQQIEQKTHSILIFINYQQVKNIKKKQSLFLRPYLNPVSSSENQC
jgi:hypothetical protein